MPFRAIRCDSHKAAYNYASMKSEKMVSRVLTPTRVYAEPASPPLKIWLLARKELESCASH
jgi:hypothetical protein